MTLSCDSCLVTLQQHDIFSHVMSIKLPFFSLLKYRRDIAGVLLAFSGLVALIRVMHSYSEQTFSGLDISTISDTCTVIQEMIANNVAF